MPNIVRVDTDTGEIKAEPPFVKAYVGHLAKVKGLPPMQTEVLYFLLCNMNYDNTVAITRKKKLKFIADQKTTSQTFSNCISKLAMVGFIDIEDVSQYFINPDYFTKSDWSKTKRLVAKWTFSENGVEFERDIIDDDGTVLIEAEEKPKPVKAITVKPKKPQVVLPEFLDTGLWNDFLAHRKKLKAPNTERALNSLLKKLANFYHAGHDVNDIIQKSYDNGWKDVFEPKGGLNGGHSAELSKSSIEQDLRFDDF